MRALVILALLVACDQGSKSTPPPTPPPITPIKQVVATTTFDLAYLPAGSDLLVQIDVARLRQSKLWPTYEADVAKIIMPFASACAYRPFDDAASAVIGVPVAKQLATFVVRGVDRDKLTSCLAGKLAGTWKATLDGNVVTVANESTTITSPARSYALTFVDASTLVMQGREHATRAELLRVIAESTNAPLSRDAAFAKALRELPQHAGVTLVSRPGSAEVAAEWKKLGVQLDHIYGNLDLDVQLTMQFSMVLPTADAATQLTQMMQAQVGNAQVKTLFDRIETHAQGTTSTLSITLGETKLSSLVTMMRGMLSTQ